MGERRDNGKLSVEVRTRCQGQMKVEVNEGRSEEQQTRWREEKTFSEATVKSHMPWKQRRYTVSKQKVKAYRNESYIQPAM